jgi:hypothetical protein
MIKDDTMIASTGSVSGNSAPRVQYCTWLRRTRLKNVENRCGNTIRTFNWGPAKKGRAFCI